MNKVILVIVIAYVVALLLVCIGLIVIIKIAINLNKKIEKKHPHISKDDKSKIFNRVIKFIIFKKTAKQSLDLQKNIDLNCYVHPYIKIYFAIVDLFSFFYLLPIFLIRMGVMIFKPKLLWTSPVSLYELWQLLLVFLGYLLAQEGNFILAIIISILNICIALNHTLDYFLPNKKGIQKILSIPKHKLRIRNVIESWGFIILGYGVLYYIVSLSTPNSFKNLTNFFDAVYFSIVTITTLGYGDIIPLSFWAKFTVISEVFIGFTYVVVVLSMFLGVYAQRILNQGKINNS